MSQYAKLNWLDGQPFSTDFEDIYFSRESGLEETRHVFLTHNRLNERWQHMQQQEFTIAETGFGTGLNFLCAWQLWNQLAPASARLHFVSTEKYPLSSTDMAKALSIWPELQFERDQLLKQYHLLCKGWHRFKFDGGRVTLTLLIGDINQTLSQLTADIDAWFLDGFAPSKNPDMWQPSLFENMARLSHAETTFSTFTSAGLVKRGLEAAGFKVGKVAGYGRKREMLVGQYVASNIPSPIPDKRAIVIGGGIAGTSSSRALAERGWQVTLIERHQQLAHEASGNPAGALYPRLTTGDTYLNRMALQGYLHSSRLLNSFQLGEDNYQACGLLQLAFDQRELERQLGILSQQLPPDLIRQVNSEEATKISGLSLQYGGLYLPSAGWVHPPAFCRALANHPNIHVELQRDALQLKKWNSLWQVWSKDALLGEAPVVIIASANETMHFSQSAHCLLEPVRGQITIANPSKQSQLLKTVICTDAYIIPTRQGIHCLGATFSNGETALDIRQSDHKTNLGLVSKMSPDLSGLEAIGGRAALRCTSADYLPLAGRLLDADALRKSPPRHNADPASLPWLAGLYVNTGHGSKGLITAPLCAEIIASALNNDPAPVDQKLMEAIDPNRFLLREMGLKRLLTTPYCKMRS